jgi:hypothetical protein
VDLHPVAQDARLEVAPVGHLTFVDVLRDPSLVTDVEAAEAVVASLVSAGLFVRERATTFEFIMHFDDVESWLGYLAERWQDAEVTPALVKRARELRGDSGEILIRQVVSAARLRRA